MQGRALVLLVVLPLLAAGCAAPVADLDSSGEPVLAGGTLSALFDGSFSVFPGDYDFSARFSQPVTKGAYGVLPLERPDLRSTLDGARIDVAVWRPDVPDGTRVPVVIQASPYYGDTSVPVSVGPMMLEAFVPHGYAYAQVAIRSTGDSGGCDDFRGPRMTADLVRVLDHFTEAEWSTGTIGMIGISYVGTTPWYAAGSGHASLKTIVPVSGSTNAWEVYARNGTPESRAPLIIANYGIGAAANTQRSPEHKVDNFACPQVYEGWVNGLVSGATGERFPAEWWQERNAKPKVEANYAGSVFLIHGLEDWNVDPAVAVPWVDHLNRTGVPVKQLLGQWAHTYPDTNCWRENSDPLHCRWDFAEILLRWFDRELKGLDVDTGPWVQVQDNEGAWRDEREWPPHDAEQRVLHLRADGSLGESGSDPGEWRLVLHGQDRAEFRLPVERDLRIAGLPKVHVTVVPDGPGGTVGAFLYDEAPDGRLTRIGWTAMNLRFAAGGDEPKDVEPGKPLVARLEIQPMDAVVAAGHNLVLRLAIATPSDRIVPPPGTPVTILAGGGVESVLQLPVIERGGVTSFVPPMP